MEAEAANFVLYLAICFFRAPSSPSHFSGIWVSASGRLAPMQCPSSDGVQFRSVTRYLILIPSSQRLPVVLPPLSSLWFEEMILPGGQGQLRPT